MNKSKEERKTRFFLLILSGINCKKHHLLKGNRCQNEKKKKCLRLQTQVTLDTRPLEKKRSRNEREKKQTELSSIEKETMHMNELNTQSYLYYSIVFFLIYLYRHSLIEIMTVE